MKGRRDSIYVRKQAVSTWVRKPNGTIPMATVEIALFYPPEGRAAARRALADATAEVWRRFDEEVPE